LRDPLQPLLLLLLLLLVIKFHFSLLFCNEIKSAFQLPTLPARQAARSRHRPGQWEATAIPFTVRNTQLGNGGDVKIMAMGSKQ